MSITLEQLKEELFKDPILKKMYEDRKIYKDVAIAFMDYMNVNKISKEELAHKLMMSERELNNILCHDLMDVSASVLVESLITIGYKLNVEACGN